MSRRAKQQTTRKALYLLIIFFSVVTIILGFYLNSTSVDPISNSGASLEQIVNDVENNIDKLWILISAALVFLMQAGFAVFEVGMVRESHGNSVAVKNLLDWVFVSIIYFFIGFKLMFGTSVFEILNQSDQLLGLEFFLFQLAFAGTAVTIVSGALAERTHLIAYLVAAIILGGFIYPLFGNWAWGLSYDSTVKPLIELSRYGFHDFAGSTVVHSIGGWFALAAIIMIGPRRKRFSNKEDTEYQPYNMGFSVLGVLILWFGWWGFNGGSLLEFDAFNISKIILNTTLSAVMSAFIAFSLSLVFDYYLRNRNLLSKNGNVLTSEDKEKILASQNEVFIQLLGGSLGGLVAITASCDLAVPAFSMLLGSLAGLAHFGSTKLLIFLQVDDPVGAVPVHGFCGFIGTIAVAFCPGVKLPLMDQLMVQSFGVLLAFCISTISAIIFFWIVANFVGLKLDNWKQDKGCVL